MSVDIRKVKDMNGLITYLAEKLSWRIDLDDFEDIEDIAYDFEAEDIGLKEEAFVKIQSLRQLPPLVDGQKWGIFCVEFDSKRFEVTALRKILSGLIPKRRNSADHAVWDQKDLLFICFWGSNNERTIGLAHFEDVGSGLPQIKMISCCPAVEDFTQIKVFEDRLKNLKWPSNYVDHNKWQEDWSNAFTTGYKQTIQDASTLTVQLAIEAQGIRDRILEIMKVESSTGYVHLLYEKFKNTLIHDMSVQQFSDMYAQTVVYGLFSARCMDETQEDFSATEAVDCIPNTNPFLKSLMRECLGAQNNSKLSFDELEIGNVVDLLLHTKTNAIIQDFNRQTGGGREDPVIHFYEEFLSAYDKSQRVQRGVYYTPQPVVNFIIKSVDHILRNDFGVADGLASTDTKKIKIIRRSKKRVDGFYYKDIEDTEEVPAIQILDPATGTGTFVRQAILQIYENFKKKYKNLSDKELSIAWNEYVPQHLLPRINAFELMMAPYAVAHMKLAMVLKDTGYNFKSDARLNVYLSNTLEEPGSSDGQLTLWDDPLATESIAANAVKKNNGINIIVGNPPYSVSSSNKGEWIQNLLNVYKEGLNEKKLNLDDDYIKFMRFGQYEIDKSGNGILAFISNSSFVDGITHRKMRLELLKEFDEIYILDLHGSVKKHETTPEGGKDENVFDIQQGVSINIFVKTSKKSTFAKIKHADLYGTRSDKYYALNENDLSNIKWSEIEVSEPYYFFAPKDFSKKKEYEKGFLITELFNVNNSGIQTDRDPLFIDFSKYNQEKKSRTLLSGAFSKDFVEKYRVVDSSSYKLTEKIKNKQYDPKYIQKIIYRPFDYRWVYYDPTLVSRPGYETMKHMLHDNWAICVKRGFDDSEAAPAFCCNQIISRRMWSRPGSLGSEYLFPLYLYSNEFGKVKRTPNFHMSAVNKIGGIIQRSFTLQNDENGFSPEDILDYIYAYLYDERYTSKYREFLKIEFPRIPYPTSAEEFFARVNLGRSLRKVHCMQDVGESRNVEYNGDPNVVIEKISRKKDAVYISKSARFSGISQEKWEYYIGGYQPLQKWIKDRKGEVLTPEDIHIYKTIVNVIEKTMEICDKIRQLE